MIIVKDETAVEDCESEQSSFIELTKKVPFDESSFEQTQDGQTSQRQNALADVSNLITAEKRSTGEKQENVKDSEEEKPKPEYFRFEFLL